ncbi:MAG: pyrroline-5-carboxylate reductase [Casimicrobiaceae bacterium]
MTITTFIGGGNMATALAGGMVARGARPDEIRIVEPLAAQREKLRARFPGAGMHPECDVAAIEGADLVVFAVKPQQMKDAARAVAPHLGRAPETVVLSIAAGIRGADLARWLGGHARIVRAMPNTPALIGKGISAIYANVDVDTAGRARCEGVLAAGGAVVWVADESMLDAVTGVSGSGPAYVFYFLEALEQAARDLGFSPADARQLAYATFEGAIALAKASPDDPASLRAQVTSKGGTTERALASMEAAGVKREIVAAVKAAARRARELGDEFGKDG